MYTYNMPLRFALGLEDRLASSHGYYCHVAVIRRCCDPIS